MGVLVAAPLSYVLAIAPAGADQTGLYLNRSAGDKNPDEKSLAETGGVFQPEYTLGLNGSGALGNEVPILLLRIEVERKPTDACQCFYDCAGMTAPGAPLCCSQRRAIVVCAAPTARSHVRPPVRATRET